MVKEPEENGNGSYALTWKWLAGILTIVILALVGSWAANMQLRINSIETLAATRSERITNMEGRIALVEQRYSIIENRLADLLAGQRDLTDKLEKHRLYERYK